MPNTYDRIMADVERIKRDKQAEREALGLSVEQFDEMAEPDPVMEVE